MLMKQHVAVDVNHKCERPHYRTEQLRQPRGWIQRLRHQVSMVTSWCWYCYGVSSLLWRHTHKNIDLNITLILEKKF